MVMAKSKLNKSVGKIDGKSKKAAGSPKAVECAEGSYNGTPVLVFTMESGREEMMGASKMCLVIANMENCLEFLSESEYAKAEEAVEEFYKVFTRRKAGK